jgi:hypothetical protein
MTEKKDLGGDSKVLCLGTQNRLQRTSSRDRESYLGVLLQNIRCDLQKEKEVFLRHQAPHSPDHKGICGNSKLAPCTFTLPSDRGTEFFRIDTIGNRDHRRIIEIFMAEQIAAGAF